MTGQQPGNNAAGTAVFYEQNTPRVLEEYYFPPA
jgi:hypothetical protein